nr:tRNA pseudouridine(55) synthase TruB [Spirulina major]
MVFGFLNLNKDPGWTSHDCVAKVRRIVGQKRVGHGGTLDPAAVGVLPIALGTATRLLQYLPTGKSYRARIRFGVTTTTDDLEGDILTQAPASPVTLPDIEAQLPAFLGRVEQIPPAFSAIQRDGKRLYELARAGEVVDVPARWVEIERISAIAFYPGDFPEVEVEVDCGAGTYIRSIARDLGAALGVGGTLAHLTRTRSCGLTLDQAIDLETLAAQVAAGTFRAIAPPIILDLPIVTPEPDAARRWCQGQTVTIAPELKDAIVQVHDGVGQFLGIGQLNTTGELLPKTVLAAQGT